MTEEQRTPEEYDENLKNKTAAKTEEFIIANSNGNGINPNPIESGNSGDWEKGIEESKKYESDAQDER